MEVLLKIAETLDCNTGDMMDFVKRTEEVESGRFIVPE
jgi:DNA-binding Xre family transcriptional regulator